MRTILARLFYTALGLKLCSGIVRTFLPFELPHRWRQLDTFGVAIRYYLRWQLESELVSPLLPAVLNSKDHYGITPMEFPFFNLVAAPWFALGPIYGPICAKAAAFLLHLLATYACVRLWRHKNLLDIPMDWLCACFLLISLASVYATKFMPDYLSFIFVFLAQSGAWLRGWRWRALLLATLGLLMKPTSVIVFAFALLHPSPFRFLKHNLVWIGGAVAACCAYYTGGMSYLRSHQDGQELFKVALQNPVANLLEFITAPRDIADLLANKLIFAPGLFVLVLAVFVDRQTQQRLAGVSALLALQILAIALLDGKHLFIHEYYLIGCAPLLLLLLGLLLRGLLTSSSRFANFLIVLLLLLALGKYVDQFYFEVRGLLPEYAARVAQSQDCSALQGRHPEVPWKQGQVFRSSNLSFPQMGVCFLEREGSERSSYGLFARNEVLPTGCAQIDAQGMAVLAHCD